MSEFSKFIGKENGDIFSFFQSFHGCSFGEAIHKAAQILKVDKPEAIPPPLHKAEQ